MRLRCFLQILECSYHFWPQDSKNPFLYPVGSKVYIRASMDTISVGNTRTVSHAGPCWAYLGCIGPATDLLNCKRSVWAPHNYLMLNFQPLAIQHPYRSKHLWKIMRACIACHLIIHTGSLGFGPYWAHKLPKSFMWLGQKLVSPLPGSFPAGQKRDRH